MFTKLTRSGGHTYVQLVESYRDETGRPRQRTVSTLGRLDESGGQVDSLLKGLLRAKGMPTSMGEAPRVRHQMTQVIDLYRGEFYFATTKGSIAHFGSAF